MVVMFVCILIIMTIILDWIVEETIHLDQIDLIHHELNESDSNKIMTIIMSMERMRKMVALSIKNIRKMVLLMMISYET